MKRHPSRRSSRLYSIRCPAAVTTRFLIPATLIASSLLLAGCGNKEGDFTADAGIFAVRTACPQVAVAAETGDITLFNPAGSTDAAAIDVVGNLTNVRSTCGENASDVVTNVTFTVQARRSSAEGARTVTLPYFLTVVRGGNAVIAKRLGQVTLNFAPGQYRAQTDGEATSVINRAAATLPEDVRERLTRKRKAGDQDAAIDPLSVPENRQAVLRATFEALVGFQLTQDQLKYNATR